MAVVKTDLKELEVLDGSPLMNAAEALGVNFGCRQGVCGTCKVEIVEGMENLEKKTDEEESMGLAPNERLMCQARIKHGTTKIRI